MAFDPKLCNVTLSNIQKRANVFLINKECRCGQALQLHPQAPWGQQVANALFDPTLCNVTISNIQEQPDVFLVNHECRCQQPLQFHPQEALWGQKIVNKSFDPTLCNVTISNLQQQPNIFLVKNECRCQQPLQLHPQVTQWGKQISNALFDPTLCNVTICNVTIGNIVALPEVFLKSNECICGQPLQLHPQPAENIKQRKDESVSIIDLRAVRQLDSVAIFDPRQWESSKYGSDVTFNPEPVKAIANTPEYMNYWATCLLCGGESADQTLSKTGVVTKAHLVHSNKAKDQAKGYDFWKTSYSEKNKYVLSSPRNFVPLCGTKTDHPGCHNLFDNYLATLLWDPFEKGYFWHIDERIRNTATYQKLLKAHLSKITTIPAQLRPYRRVLAGRAVHAAHENVDSSLLQHPSLTLMCSATPKRGSEPSETGSQHAASMAPSSRVSSASGMSATRGASQSGESESFEARKQKRAQRFGTSDDKASPRFEISENDSWEEAMKKQKVLP